MKKLHIGMIGAGFIGVMHANAIETIVSEKFVSAEFTAVCDKDAERARAIAGSFGAAKHCDDAIGLINSGDIDTVFICTPTSTHPELVKAAAERGLHILCEKPLARSLAEAREMHAAVAASGVRNQVGLVLWFSPVFHEVKRLICDPGLGRPMAAVFRDDQYFPIQGIYGSTWRSDVAAAGGGTLIEHSIHDVDIMRWLLGEIKSVSAVVRNYAGHEGVEDLTAAQIEFESGCVGQLSSIWHNMLGRESNRLLEIFFENGYISTTDDFIGPVNYQAQKGEMKTIPAQEVLDAYLASAGLAGPGYGSLQSMQGLQDYHFLRALEEGVDPQPDIGVALKAHEAVEAIYEAARTGSRVSLAPAYRVE